MSSLLYLVPGFAIIYSCVLLFLLSHAAAAARPRGMELAQVTTGNRTSQLIDSLERPSGGLSVS
jgi:hypothetical protein